MQAPLKRFSAATAELDALIAYVKRREGFVARGADFPTGASPAPTALRARAQVAPAALDQAEIDRIGREASCEKRRSVARAVRRPDDLGAVRAAHPDLSHLLPSGRLRPPRSGGRPDAIVRSQLPATFRTGCARVFVLATETPADQARRMRDRIKAREDEAQVLAVRAAMLARRDQLELGATAVVGRFFRIAAARREPSDAPSRAALDAAAESEATPAAPLRSLKAFAPKVDLAGGRGGPQGLVGPSVGRAAAGGGAGAHPRSRLSAADDAAPSAVAA